jgi:hypothetical protein
MPQTIRIPRPAGYLPEREYQVQVKTTLDRLYRDVEVQWQPFRGGGRASYAPVVDIAVGPFAIERTYVDEYAQLLNGTRTFIEALIRKHNENIGKRPVVTVWTGR